MSETKAGRKMSATHHVAGAVGPVSCDSMDNLLVLANERIAALAAAPDPRIAAADAMAKALEYYGAPCERNKFYIVTAQDRAFLSDFADWGEMARAALAAYNALR